MSLFKEKSFASKPKLNSDQRAVVDAPKSNILVSAAAGSGKTAVLKERILERVKQGELSLDRLLLITFTNNTAVELREKVLQTLQEELKYAQGIEKERLEKAIYQIPFAQISTIHAFCLSVIKEFQYLLPDLQGESGDPFKFEGSLKTLNEDEVNLLFDQALEMVLREFYEKYPEPLEVQNEDIQAQAQAFYALMDAYGKNLKDTLKSNYQKWRSLSNYKQALEKFTDEYFSKIEDEQDEVYQHFEQRFVLLKTEYEKRIQACQHFLLEHQDLILLKDRKKNKERLLELQEFCETSLRASQSLEKQSIWELHSKQLLFPEKIPSITIRQKDEALDQKEQLKSLLNHTSILEFRSLFGLKVSKDKIQHFRFPYCPFLTQSVKVYQAEKKALFPVLKVYQSLLESLDFRFTALKREKQGIDFDDYEHLALYLLQTDVVKSHYRQHFQEVYVDEYQDTSAIQESILECIATDNLFTVGDIKQSIYRFRKAKPQNFLTRMQGYTQVEQAGKLLKINENFRSQENIVDGVNQIFSAIMQEEFSELRYDENHSLKAFSGNLKRNKVRPHNLNLWLFPKKEEKASDTEVLLDEETDYKNENLEQQRVEKDAVKRNKILEEIIRLKSQGVSYSDIAILAPKHKFLEAMLPLFEKVGIPHTKAKEVKFFNRFFFLQFEAFLQLIDNPYQDYPLSVLLYGGLFCEAFSTQDLALLAYLAKQWKIFFHRSIEKATELFKNLKQHPEDKDLLFWNQLLDLSEWKEEALHNWFLKLVRFDEQLKFYRILAQETDVLTLFEYVLQEQNVLEKVKTLAQKEAPFLTEEIFETRRWLSQLDLKNMRLAEVLFLIQEGKAKEKKVRLNTEQKAEAVKLETFHGSKGLQYKYVFLLGLDYSLTKELSKEKKEVFVLEDRFGFFPVLSKRNQQFSAYKPLLDLQYAYYEYALHKEAKAEFQRLLYVALTRAEEYLYILGDLTLTDEGLKQAYDALAKQGYLPTEILVKANSFFEWIQMALSLEILKKVFYDEPLEYLAVNQGQAEWTLSYFENLSIEKEDTAQVLDVPQDEKIVFTLPVYEQLSQHEQTIHHFLNTVQHQVSSKKTENIPLTKTSVSVLKALHQEDTLEEDAYAALKVHVSKPLKNILDIEQEQGYKGAKLGSLYHRYFELLPLKFDALNTQTRLDFFFEQGLFKKEEYDVLVKNEVFLKAFEETSLYDKMREAKKNHLLFREMPFTISTQIKGETILVQGRIDLWFVHQNQVYLLDYKSDLPFLDGKMLTHTQDIHDFLKHRYAFQLSCYAEALKKTLKKNIDFIYIFHIPSQTLYLIDLEK